MACICKPSKKNTEQNILPNRCRFRWWKTFISNVICQTPNMENQFFKITKKKAAAATTKGENVRQSRSIENECPPLGKTYTRKSNQFTIVNMPIKSVYRCYSNWWFFFHLFWYRKFIINWMKFSVDSRSSLNSAQALGHTSCGNVLDLYLLKC